MVIAACSDGSLPADLSIPPGRGAETPLGAVEELVAAINAPDFAEASRFAIPDQAALASLAEGATIGAVANALRDGDEEVAANFWAGFAQGAGDFLVDPVRIAESGTTSEGEVDFVTLTVTPASGDSRTMLVRDIDGYRVDLFASFGSGLADKMTPPVERLLATQTADARLILDRLQAIVPSLLAASRLPSNSGDVSQQLLALVEVITRVR
jgi:hypothetical protein